MPQDLRRYNLLDTLVRQSRLPWLWATAAQAIVLLLLLVLALFLDGALTGELEWSTWRESLMPPVIISYVLLASRPLQRLLDRTDCGLGPARQ